jgi:hypothetical protein
MPGERVVIIIIMDDHAWDHEYEPSDLIDVRIDQLPPHNPACLWTQISDGGLSIVNGCRVDNRKGFYFTAQPAAAGQVIRVVITPEDTLTFGKKSWPRPNYVYLVIIVLDRTSH